MPAALDTGGFVPVGKVKLPQDTGGFVPIGTTPTQDVGFLRGFAHPEERIPSNAGLWGALKQYAGHVLGGAVGLMEKGGKAATGAGPLPSPGEALGMASMAVEPAAPGMSAAGDSLLGRAIARGDAGGVDRALTRTFRSVVKPSRAGIDSAPKLARQDTRILSAVDSIIKNRPPGQTPRSLSDFANALDETKGKLFQQYDALAKQAGDAGLRVDLKPAINRLLDVASSPEVEDAHPDLVREAENWALRLEQRGSYSPSEAQALIQNLNQTLAGFWKNPTHETVSRASLLAPVVATLRESLEKAIDKAGPGYAALRRQYGALRDIEKHVAAAAQREANKIPGGIGGIFADLGGTEEALRGVLTMNPAALARAVGFKAAKAALKYIHDPNRAIMRMFQRRAGTMSAGSPGTAARGLSDLALRRMLMGGGTQQAPAPAPQVGAQGPRGGTINAVRSTRRPTDYIEPPPPTPMP